MLKIFFLTVSENHSTNWKAYLETLPPPVQDEILRQKTPTARIQKTFARILLRKILMGFGHRETILNDMEISEHGKPFISSFPGAFNKASLIVQSRSRVFSFSVE